VGLSVQPYLFPIRVAMSIARTVLEYICDKTKLNSVAFGPRANYADRATAAS
jgi:hypothetical protein